MSNNGAPDSWETQVDTGSGEANPADPNDMSAKFSTLNVNAVEFVPSFCIPATGDENTESPTTSPKSESASTNSASSPVLNGGGGSTEVAARPPPTAGTRKPTTRYSRPSKTMKGRRERKAMKRLFEK